MIGSLPIDVLISLHFAHQKIKPSCRCKYTIVPWMLWDIRCCLGMFLWSYIFPSKKKIGATENGSTNTGPLCRCSSVATKWAFARRSGFRNRWTSKVGDLTLRSLSPFPRVVLLRDPIPSEKDISGYLPWILRVSRRYIHAYLHKSTTSKFIETVHTCLVCLSYD